MVNWISRKTTKKGINLPSGYTNLNYDLVYINKHNTPTTSISI